MTSTKVGNQIAAQLQACGNAVIKGQREAVESASFILKAAIEGELVKAVGPDKAMSNVRSAVRYSRSKQTRSVGDVKSSGGGVALSLRYDVKGVNNPTALLRAVGPWGLIEYNVPDHSIFPRLSTIPTRGIRRNQRRYMMRERELNQAFGVRGTYSGVRPMPVAEGVYRFSARNHPGTTGKRPFGKGMDKASPRARRELNTVVLRGVASVWNSGRDVITSFREG